MIKVCKFINTFENNIADKVLEALNSKDELLENDIYNFQIYMGDYTKN